MKNIILLLAIILIGSLGFAQRTITDTLQGNENVNFTTMIDPSQIHVLASELGGTSDGSITLQGSVDGTSFINIQPTARLFYYFPDDTADLTGYTWTITDAGSLLIILEKLPPLRYYRIRGDGEVNDTTLITITWSK